VHRKVVELGNQSIGTWKYSNGSVTTRKFLFSVFVKERRLSGQQIVLIMTEG